MSAASAPTPGRYGPPGYNPLARTAAAAAVAATEDRDPHEIAYDRLVAAAGEQFKGTELTHPTPEVVDWVRMKATEIVGRLNDQSLAAVAHAFFEKPGEDVVQALMNDFFGMGPLEELLRDPDVEDIAVNGPKDIHVFRNGHWERVEHVTFISSVALARRLNSMVVHTNRQFGPLTPIVDAHLAKGGHRISILTEPVATPWPAAVIRKHHERHLTMHDLVASGGQAGPRAVRHEIPDYYASATPGGTFSPLAATFLHMAVVAGFNVVVVGPTGVGKTTVVNALGTMIPLDRRIVVIEDTRELSIRPIVDGVAHNCVYFTTRPQSPEGAPAVTAAMLVEAALRQRPDALTLGEARGAEVFDLLKALWTGHRNGLTSIHADSIAELPDRIRMMLQERQFRTEVSEDSVSMWIAHGLQLAVMLRMADDGRRYVEEITEFTGVVEGRAPARNPLFEYDPAARRLRFTGARLHHESRFGLAGFDYERIREAARQTGEAAR